MSKKKPAKPAKKPRAKKTARPSKDVNARAKAMIDAIAERTERDRHAAQ